jgi:hypothetical protein
VFLLVLFIESVFLAIPNNKDSIFVISSKEPEGQINTINSMRQQQVLLLRDPVYAALHIMKVFCFAIFVGCKFMTEAFDLSENTS